MAALSGKEKKDRAIFLKERITHCILVLNSRYFPDRLKPAIKKEIEEKKLELRLLDFSSYREVKMLGEQK